MEEGCLSCSVFFPIHVGWLSCYQYIFVDLGLCIFFLSYLYHNHSLSIDLCCFGSIYLLCLFFLSSPYHLGHGECSIGRFSAWSDNLGEGECGYMSVVVCRVLCDVENDEVAEEWLWDEG